MIAWSAVVVGVTVAFRPAHPDTIHRFAERVSVGRHGPVRFRFYSPPSAAQPLGKSAPQHPLVIWFHGAGEAGHDNREQLAWLELVFGDDAQPRSPEAFVLALQFAPATSAADRALQERDFERLDVAWADVMRRAAVDPDRIYLAGISQGANHAWQYACRHPGRFAALLAMATMATDELPDCDLRGLSIWAFASSYDGPAQVDRMQKRLHASRVNAAARVTAVESPSHDCWTAALLNYPAWQWLMDQRRGRPVRRYYQSAVGRYLSRRQAAAAGAVITLLAAEVGRRRVRRGQRRMPTHLREADVDRAREVQP